MDFLNKLGKKANEIYKDTKEKTTQISGELKLKGKISDSRNRIEELYLEIGEIVYSRTKNGGDVLREDIAFKCDEITKLFEEIEKSGADILELKNIRKCANCGTEIEKNIEFCPKCGKAQTKEDANVEVKNNEPTESKTAEDAEVTNVENVNED